VVLSTRKQNDWPIRVIFELNLRDACHVSGPDESLLILLLLREDNILFPERPKIIRIFSDS